MRSHVSFNSVVIWDVRSLISANFTFFLFNSDNASKWRISAFVGRWCDRRGWSFHHLDTSLIQSFFSSLLISTQPDSLQSHSPFLQSALLLLLQAPVNFTCISTVKSLPSKPLALALHLISLTLQFLQSNSIK